MTCAEARSLRLRWLDGEAGPDAAPRLAAHAASCAQCGPALTAQLAEDEIQRSGAGLLDAAARAAQPPADFSGKVLSRLPKASTGKLVPPVPEAGEKLRSAQDLDAVRRRRWLRIWTAAAAAAILVSLGAWAAGAAMRARVILAEVVAMNGSPEASRLPWERFLPLVQGESLASGAVLRTGAGAQVRLRFKDGSLVDLGSDSRLVLEGPRSGRLQDGRVHIAAAKDAESWILETPEGTVRTLGTVFSVSLEKPATPPAAGATEKAEPLRRSP